MLTCYIFIVSKNNWNNTINKNIIDKLPNRSLYYETSKENDSKLNKFLYDNFSVDSIYNYFEPISTFNDTYGYIKITKYISDEIKIIKGRALNEENFNEILIPENFIIDGKLQHFFELVDNNLILKIQYREHYKTIKLKVVGVYENDKTTTNIFYATKLTLNSNEDTIKKVVVFEKTNIAEKAKEYLENKDVNVNFMNNEIKEEKRQYLILNMVLKCFIICIFVLVFILNFIIIKIIISNNCQNIAIMKVIGYSTFKIINSFFIFFINIINISTILLFIEIILIGEIIRSFVFKTYYFCFIYGAYILCLLIIILLQYKKLNKLSIISIKNKYK